MPACSIRPWREGDDLAALTRVIHAAYAPHLSNGLRFWATHQSVEDTGKRIRMGRALIAEAAGEMIGTLTLRPPMPNSPVALYREADVWTLSQFAVMPEYKGKGVGVALHDHGLQVAAREGARRAALDTAEPAQGLIDMYRKWGYVPCGHCDWRPHTNYRSIVMVRDI